MTKREFLKRIKDATVLAERIAGALSDIDLDEIKGEIEGIGSDIQDSLENIKSEALQDEWQERSDSMDAILEILGELEEMAEKASELVSTLEELQ